MKKTYCYVILLILFCASIGIVAYPFLPDQIPIHWNYQGEVDGYQIKGMIFAVPVLMTVITLIFALCQYIDPRKKNYKKFTSSYASIILGINIFMCAVYFMNLVICFYPNQFDIRKIIMICVGALFVLLGNVMPRFRSNFFFGVRTPWALSDEAVWQKTHRFSGRLFFFAGILLVLGAAAPSSFTGLALCSIIITTAVIPAIYSYLIYKKLH